MKKQELIEKISSSIQEKLELKNEVIYANLTFLGEGEKFLNVNTLYPNKVKVNSYEEGVYMGSIFMDYAFLTVKQLRQVCKNMK